LNAIHIANNDGVTYVNVYRRSLSSSLNTSNPGPKTQTSSNRDSQGLRRPRFSFFIFTCQTARGPKTPLPFLEGLRRPHSTANDNRLASAVDSLILVRSFTGTKTCLGQGPRQRRAQWAVYKPARSALSTVVVNKSSHHRGILHCKEVSIFKDLAPYLSHNPATFWHYVSIESPGDQWGLPAFHYSRDRRSQMNPSPFPCGQETSRDLHIIVVRDPGLPFGL
jgi:hypothetical protein